MVETSREEFKQAYRKEKDPRVVKRMAAVNMAYYNQESTQHVADSLMQCPNWVLTWVRRFEEGGIDALRDLPRSGRPPRIDRATMDNMLSEAGQSKTTPAELRQKIRREAGILFHMTYVRKLMYRTGLSAKTSTMGFNDGTSMPYIRALLRRFKRVALILDRAPTHRSRRARKTFDRSRNVEFIYLPKASPYLNASEQCWNRGKRDLLNSEHYETFGVMCKAVSTYFRTIRFDLDVHKYLNGKASKYS